MIVKVRQELRDNERNAFFDTQRESVEEQMERVEVLLDALEGVCIDEEPELFIRCDRAAAFYVLRLGLRGGRVPFMSLSF